MILVEAAAKRPQAPRTLAAPLLYWLLVVCGLSGITLLRLDELGEMIPLWIGAIGGVGLGQLCGLLRVRLWLLAVMAMATFWFAPFFFFVTYASMSSAFSMGAIAFLPAAACGYLSLSERGALVAFWFPAMLWMLVILDGPAPGVLDARAALPLLVGLGALFVAFLHARETRRVALWRSYATSRLAVAAPRAVLRSSPLRAASQHAWTAAAGAGALVLAAWIAPHLWQKEVSKHAAARAAAAAGEASVAGTGPYAEGDLPGLPCCPDEEGSRVRVRELLPIGHGRDEALAHAHASTCRACRHGASRTSAAEGATGDGPGTNPGAGNGTSDSTTSWSSTAATGGGTPLVPDATSPARAPTAGGPTASASGTPTPIAPTVAAATTSAPRVPAPVVPAAPLTASPVAVAVAADHAAPSGVAPPRPRVTLALVPKAAATPPDVGAPWRSMLALCLAALALHAVWRGVRRQLTLRHLAHPFWAETLDQRISNQWERMLIGLRDAGIAPAPGEQPSALARRVGIDGMDRCATILERVRHGVRVDEGDLDAMSAAAGDVYRSARERAGAAARAAAWLRWPLA